MNNKSEHKLTISSKTMETLKKTLTIDEITFLTLLIPYISDDHFLEYNDERLDVKDFTNLINNYTYNDIKQLVFSLVRNRVLTECKVGNCNTNIIKTFYMVNEDVLSKEMSLEEYINDEWMGFVYFIQAGDNGAIKIGYTKDVDRRIKELQTSNPEKLNLLLKVGAEPNDEKVMHDKFKKYCINLEWYSPSDELINFIRKFQSYGCQIKFDHDYHEN